MSSANKVDVIVVGAGPAGLACAHTLAQKGAEVVVIERGSFPGAKNLFGGIFFSPYLEKLFPDFLAEAPWERFVSKRRISLLAEQGETAIEIRPESFNIAPYNHSFIVRRSQIDSWFAKRVEASGVSLLCEYCVKDFVWEGKKVVGVCGEGAEDRLLADVVVCAEGANSLLAQKSGLRKPLEPKSRSIAVKENIRLPRETIDDRFGLTGRQGAAYEFFGTAVDGMLGSGFIYTYGDSLSVGVGFMMEDFIARRGDKNPNDLLDEFKAHSAVAPLLRGGDVVEYMTHMIPCDAYASLPTMHSDGLVLVGDAAGLVNNSFLHEGVNLAMASGVMAGETILEALAKKDFSSATLATYPKKLADSFVLQDLKKYRNFIPFVASHRRILQDYPELLSEVLADYYSVSEKSKAQVQKEILNKIGKKIGFVRLAGDMLGVMRNLI